MKYSLWKFFGLQRSGNHAVLNWLIGLHQEHTLFFNMVKPERDLLEKPSGVSVPEGTRAYAKRVDGKLMTQPENLEWFKKHGGRLLISYENYPISRFSSERLNRPVYQLFGKSDDEKNLLVLRNPFNMIPSAENMLRRTMSAKNRDEEWLVSTLDKRLDLWKSYALLHINRLSPDRGDFITFLFDRWVSERSYRDAMAERLGHENQDRFLDFVSDAGRGSSFSGTSLPDVSAVVSRWNQGGSICEKLILKNPDIIDYTVEIFGEDAVPKRFHEFRK